MQIKNILLITVASLSLTTLVQAEGFNIGFSSSANTPVSDVHLSDETSGKLTEFNLGFNSSIQTKADKRNISIKQLAKIHQNNTALKSFNLGSDS